MKAHSIQQILIQGGQQMTAGERLALWRHRYRRHKATRRAATLRHLVAINCGLQHIRDPFVVERATNIGLRYLKRGDSFHRALEASKQLARALTAPAAQV